MNLVGRAYSRAAPGNLATTACEYARPTIEGPMRDFRIEQANHEPGRADLPVGLDARQRVPTLTL